MPPGTVESGNIPLGPGYKSTEDGGRPAQQRVIQPPDQAQLEHHEPEVKGTHEHQAADESKTLKPATRERIRFAVHAHVPPGAVDIQCLGEYKGEADRNQADVHHARVVARRS